MFTSARVYVNKRQIYFDLKSQDQAADVSGYLARLPEVASVASKNKLLKVDLNTSKDIWNRMYQWYTYWDEKHRVVA